MNEIMGVGESKDKCLMSMSIITGFDFSQFPNPHEFLCENSVTV